MRIGPATPANFLPVRAAATNVDPEPVRQPEVSSKAKLEAAWAGFLTVIGHIPGFTPLGHKLYGLMTRPKAGEPALDNLGQLNDGLLRGAQPSAAGFARLAARGVTTVINFRPEAPQEAETVKALGLRYIYMPLPAVAAPTTAHALAFLQAVTDPANGKVYFHCYHGRDRTGAMAAAYRIAVEGWPAERAIAEMRAYGFKEGLHTANLAAVRQFAADWAALPEAERARVLHR